MLSALVERTRKDLSVLRSTLDMNERIRLLSTRKRALRSHAFKSVVDVAPSALDWRINDHCFTITRLYAIYERFVEECVSSWLRVIQMHHKFDLLPGNIRETYVYGISTLLRRLGQRRIEHLTVERIATALHDAVGKQPSYELLPEAFLVYEQNLRADILNSVLANCGLAGAESWLDHHQSLEDFFVATSAVASAGSIRGLTRAHLQSFVDYRNDAAHGAVQIDEVLGPSALREYISFVDALCQALSDFVMWRLVNMLQEQRLVVPLGDITERYSNNIVILRSDHAYLFVGQQLHAVSAERYMCVEVLSLQLNDVDIDRVVANSTEPIEIGVRLSENIAKSSMLINIPDELITRIEELALVGEADESGQLDERYDAEPAEDISPEEPDSQK
jgi:hypothetical protein